MKKYQEVEENNFGLWEEGLLLYSPANLTFKKEKFIKPQLGQNKKEQNLWNDMIGQSLNIP